MLRNHAPLHVELVKIECLRRPEGLGGADVGSLYFASIRQSDATSQKRSSGSPSLTRSPRQPTMSAARGASTVTNAGGWGACSPLRLLKLDG